MEDYGYKKNSEKNSISSTTKKVLLVSAVLTSLSIFIYVTINAYLFVYGNENEIETIKSPQEPIKIVEDDEEKRSDDQHLIYEGIFDDKIDNNLDKSRIKQPSVPPLPPKERLQNSEMQTDTKKDGISAENNSSKQVEQSKNQTPETLTSNNPKEEAKNQETAAVKNKEEPRQKMIVFTQNQRVLSKNDILVGSKDNKPRQVLANQLPNKEVVREVQNNLSGNGSKNLLQQSNNPLKNGDGSNSLNKDHAQKELGQKQGIKVQIAAMSSKELLKEHWQKIQKNNSRLFSNLKPSFEEIDLGKKGAFHRLKIGNFNSRTSAEEFCKRYLNQPQKSKSDCIVVE